MNHSKLSLNTRVALAALGAALASGPAMPRRMEVGVTPQDVCQAFDVYLNGVLQDGCCVVADVDAGYVVRYVRTADGKFMMRHDKRLLMQRVNGKVEFRRKGERYKTGEAIPTAVGGEGGVPEENNSGDAGGVPCRTAAPEAEAK